MKNLEKSREKEHFIHFYLTLERLRGLGASHPPPLEKGCIVKVYGCSEPIFSRPAY